MSYYPIAANSDDRSGRSITPIRMRNVILTPLPGDAKRGARFAAVPRPGLVKRATPSPGSKIRGLFHQPGFHASALYAIASGTLYSLNSLWAATAIGAVTDSTRAAQLDALLSSLVMVSGGNIFNYDATTLTTVTDADAPSPAESLCIFGARAVVSQQYTDVDSWSELGNAINWPALGFASSEAKSDAIAANVTVGAVMLTLGAVTTQAFQAVGGPDESAIQVDPTYTTEIGLLTRDAMTVFDEGVFFIAQDKDGNRTPCMIADLQPRRIANPALCDRLAVLPDDQVARLRTFGVGWRERKIWVVRMPDGKPSLAYDLSTQTWAEWTSFESATLAMGFASAFGAQTAIADPDGDALYTLEDSAYDDDGSPIERLLTFHAPVRGPTPINSIALDIKCHGQPVGAAPKARVRYYFDGGSLDSVTEWSDERTIDLPALGDYSIPAPEHKFGLARSPNGILIEIAITEPIGFTCYGIWINELP